MCTDASLGLVPVGHEATLVLVVHLAMSAGSAARRG